MSIFVRMKRSVVALALLAGALVYTAAPARAAATTLGDITGFAADKATYTLSAGAAKVRVVFLKDDVFRLWMAPDGNFTGPGEHPAHRSGRSRVQHRHQDGLRHAADLLA